MGGGRSRKVLVRRWDAGVVQRAQDEVIVEEPLAIRLDGTLVATTMRTPGHDFELATGFCFTEGLLAGAPVLACRYCGEGRATDSDFNVVTVETGGQAPTPQPRLGPTTAACGLCGSASLADLEVRLAPVPPSDPIDVAVLLAVPRRVAGSQALFDRTGGVHAAATFDRNGTIGCVREDIGRHNAVDKVVGRLLLDGQLPAHGRGLFVSGRASFEMVQKAWAAGFSTLLSVSAPSSLAIDAATTASMTLAGFVRGERLNVYVSGP